MHEMVESMISFFQYVHQEVYQRAKGFHRIHLFIRM